MASKGTSEDEFITALRSRGTGMPGPAASAAPASGHVMKLNLPPTGERRKSLDELVSGEPAAQVSEPALEKADGHREPSAGAADTGYYISLDLLDPHPWNARVHRDPARIREIASEIAATRQNHPIGITPNPEKPGRHFIVDGETRYHALRLLNRKEAWVLHQEVDPTDPLAFYKASFKQTNSTKRISAIDQGIKWGRLVQGGFATTESIAQTLELNKGTVSRMTSYAKFPEAVLDFMHEHEEKFSYSVAAVLTPILDRGLDTDDVLHFLEKVVDEDLSRRDIESYLKTNPTADSKRPRKAAVLARPIKSGNAQIGGFRTYENGALEFKLKNTGTFEPKTVDELSNLLSITSDILSEGREGLIDELITRLRESKTSGS
ncbi:ParB/RepB/Spo0J family partition protein [Burkholderia sp. LMG 13014]|uniref:ParB/RepB/Spo0J family partition protein n=1 Tax=Burkholderia sp. LMG 13014 TaxID=2709306 RepID=UPI001966934B|nr:ParB/RepB/Spo0J family partition protein [Burkholderia sp. LMG 13014]